jgi:hypothetical protein
MDTDRFAQLIDAKLTVLRQLQAIAQKQLLAIEESELTSLLSVLAAKQQLLDVLKQLDSQLEPYRAQDPESRIWRTPQDRVRCRQQAERCEAILRDVLGLEKQAESAMIRRREDVTNQIQQLDHAANAQRAYVQTPVAASSSLDLTSEG